MLLSTVTATLMIYWWVVNRSTSEREIEALILNSFCCN